MDKELVKIDYKILRLKSLKETPGNPQKMTPVEYQGLINSMKKDGWILDAPVVWHRPDGEYQIISGHHRVSAGIEAGIVETGMKVVEGISEENVLIKVLEANQRRGIFNESELNIFINNINEKYSIPMDEIYTEIGLYDEEEKDERESKYTKKIDAPIYEPKNEKPNINSLVDHKKTDEMITEIMSSPIPVEEKEFLIKCARRHTVFNYSKIADYYAHSSKEVQELMEKSALVIIDFKSAIRNGYVELSKNLIQQYEVDYNE